MRYPLTIAGFEGQKLEVDPGTVFTSPKLFVDDEPAPKGGRFGQMLLHSDDGTEMMAEWKQRMMGLDVPELMVAGQTVRFAEPLKWYALVWSALPIVLVLIGGLSGAMIGIIASGINSQLFRSSQRMPLTFVLTGFVTAAAFAAYFVVAYLLQSAL